MRLVLTFQWKHFVIFLFIRALLVTLVNHNALMINILIPMMLVDKMNNYNVNFFFNMKGINEKRSFRNYSAVKEKHLLHLLIFNDTTKYYFHFCALTP